jgi:hypothetical protein
MIKMEEEDISQLIFEILSLIGIEEWADRLVDQSLYLATRKSTSTIGKLFIVSVCF